MTATDTIFLIAHSTALIAACGLFYRLGMACQTEIPRVDTTHYGLLEYMAGGGK